MGVSVGHFGGVHIPNSAPGQRQEGWKLAGAAFLACKQGSRIPTGWHFAPKTSQKCIVVDPYLVGQQKRAGLGGSGYPPPRNAFTLRRSPKHTSPQPLHLFILFSQGHTKIIVIYLELLIFS